jgi:hypothetical protein
MKCFGCLHDRLVAKELDATRIEFKQLDVLDCLQPSEKFDLVVTNSFLDCFQARKLEQLIPQLAQSVTTEVAWLSADFRELEYGWRNIS